MGALGDGVHGQGVVTDFTEQVEDGGEQLALTLWRESGAHVPTSRPQVRRPAGDPEWITGPSNETVSYTRTLLPPGSETKSFRLWAAPQVAARRAHRKHGEGE
ncbi:hypothetical protein Sfulv_24580 [Streptomyces fulvorobeus]|uniref:Uncharacterized protein n=1 Tax=Streptomyces fulvorobeus TaxID=284028 RepID=A0A7J0C674_9ACTN|nr:hypothetical protein Sfulv_24580 [Streptomyces fulvorobeus]